MNLVATSGLIFKTLYNLLSTAVSVEMARILKFASIYILGIVKVSTIISIASSKLNNSILTSFKEFCLPSFKAHHDTGTDLEGFSVT